jgi:hypothetical protein
MVSMSAIIWSQNRQPFAISDTQFSDGMNHPIHTGKLLKTNALCLNLNLKIGVKP